MNLFLTITRDIIIVLLCCLSIAAAIYTFTTKRLVWSILFFIQLVISLSLALFIYKPLYISILYIIVYIGAVAVLFLFVLMLIDLRNEVNINVNQNFNNLKIKNFYKFLFFLLILFNSFNYLDLSNFYYFPIDSRIWSNFYVEQILQSLKNIIGWFNTFEFYVNNSNVSNDLFLKNELIYLFAIWNELLVLYNLNLETILVNLLTMFTVEQLNLISISELINLYSSSVTFEVSDYLVNLTLLVMSSLVQNNMIIYDLATYFTYLPMETNLTWFAPLFTIHSPLLFMLGVLLFVSLLGTILTSKNK